MATHSSTPAWKIPWMEEPGRLQSMGSLRVGHDRATSLSLFTFMNWRRKWQPTPVFLPRESQGRGSLVGCCLWGCTESDTADMTWQQQWRQENWTQGTLVLASLPNHKAGFTWAANWDIGFRIFTILKDILYKCKNDNVQLFLNT